jgi:hypothetical protein
VSSFSCECRQISTLTVNNLDVRQLQLMPSLTSVVVVVVAIE